MLRDLTNLAGITKDVDSLISSFLLRARVAEAAAHFWLSRTIAQLPEQLTRPGLIYAYPAFPARHGLFTGDDPWVWPGYKEPDAENHRVADEMLDSRTARIPRRGLQKRFEAARWTWSRR